MARFCTGCGEQFASNEAFEMHATGSAHPKPFVVRKCRTTEQMRALGMGKIRGSRTWYITPTQAKRGQ